LATSFDLQSHHQAILNHIIIDILCGSADIWDPKMFTEWKLMNVKPVVYMK